MRLMFGMAMILFLLYFVGRKQRVKLAQIIGKGKHIHLVIGRAEKTLFKGVWIQKGKLVQPFVNVYHDK